MAPSSINTRTTIATVNMRAVCPLHEKANVPNRTCSWRFLEAEPGELTAEELQAGLTAAQRAADHPAASHFVSGLLEVFCRMTPESTVLPSLEIVWKLMA